MKAVNRVTGSVVSADAEIVKRLGSEWEVREDAPAKAPAKKAAAKPSAEK